MPTVRAGYRRLYLAHGAEPPEPGLLTRLELQPDLIGSFYFGRKPSFSIFTPPAARYAVLGPNPVPIPVKLGNALEPSSEDQPSPAYTEVVVLASIDLTQETFDAFMAETKGSESAIWKALETRRDLVHGALDLVAGSIGLLFHRQFVIELVNEHPIAIRGSGHISSYSTPFLEILGNPALTTHGEQAIKDLLKTLSQVTPEAILGEAKPLYWLLKAWPHQDSIGRFLALFIPMEMILQGVTVPRSKEHRAQERFIRRVVKAKAKKGTRAAYKRHLDSLYGRIGPSLDARFAAFAEGAGMPDKEADVRAFKAFNRLRNALLHRGEPDVSFRIELTSERVRTLEDLVERYVCFALFGHSHVYPHRFRPHQ